MPRPLTEGTEAGVSQLVEYLIAFNSFDVNIRLVRLRKDVLVIEYRLSVMCRTWLSKCAVTYGTPSRARLTANKRVEPVVSIS